MWQRIQATRQTTTGTPVEVDCRVASQQRTWPRGFGDFVFGSRSSQLDKDMVCSGDMDDRRGSRQIQRHTRGQNYDFLLLPQRHRTRVCPEPVSDYWSSHIRRSMHCYQLYCRCSRTQCSGDRVGDIVVIVIDIVVVVDLAAVAIVVPYDSAEAIGLLVVCCVGER